jgi:serine/threonine protein kinase
VEHDATHTAAVCVSSDGEASPLTPSSRSRSFSTVGSDYYAAPELAYGGSYNTAVDVYSLGVTLYIILCGFPPVFGDAFNDCIDDDDGFQILFPDTYWTNISEGAKDLLRKMLHPDPAVRITAKEALNDAWIHDCLQKDRQRLSKTQLDFDLIRSQLFKKLGERKKRRSIPQDTQLRKRHHRRLQRRASTSALMALADLYRGVAAPSVVMAAASAAAAEATHPSRTNSPSSVEFVSGKPAMTAAISF